MPASEAPNVVRIIVLLKSKASKVACVESAPLNARAVAREI